MSETRFTVCARIYNYFDKGHDFIEDAKYFYNLDDAKKFAKWYVENFNVVVHPSLKLRAVWIESAACSNQIPIYGRADFRTKFEVNVYEYADGNVGAELFGLRRITRNVDEAISYAEWIAEESRRVTVTNCDNGDVVWDG